MVRKYWWVIVIMLLFPFIVNLLNLYTTPHEVFQEPLPWTMFWGTYLSSIASFSMVLITWLTLTQTQKRWENERRPYIEVSYITNYYHYSQDSNIYLEVYNSGQSTAHNVKFEFSSDFYNLIDNISQRDSIKRHTRTPFKVEARNTRRFSFMSVHPMPNGRDALYTIFGVMVSAEAYFKIHEQIFDNQNVITGIYNDKYEINQILSEFSKPHITKTESLQEIVSEIEKLRKTIETHGQQKSK